VQQKKSAALVETLLRLKANPNAVDVEGTSDVYTVHVIIIIIIIVIVICLFICLLVSLFVSLFVYWLACLVGFFSS
jgi:hypothetical protein